MKNGRLGVGFVGSGFNTRFHIQGFTGVRDADVLGVWSPNRKRAEEHAILGQREDSCHNYIRQPRWRKVRTRLQ